MHLKVHIYKSVSETWWYVWQKVPRDNARRTSNKTFNTDIQINFCCCRGVPFLWISDHHFCLAIFNLICQDHTAILYYHHYNNEGMQISQWNLFQFSTNVQKGAKFHRKNVFLCLVHPLAVREASNIWQILQNLRNLVSVDISHYFWDLLIILSVCMYGFLFLQCILSPEDEVILWEIWCINVCFEFKWSGMLKAKSSCV